MKMINIKTQSIYLVFIISLLLCFEPYTVLAGMDFYTFNMESTGNYSKNLIDECPNDPDKTEPGECGCGVPDTDSDGDKAPDCHDECPNDPGKIYPAICGCGVEDTDSDEDGTADCEDKCPYDLNKIEPGKCGCGVKDTDSDNDGTPDCYDNCPDDPDKLEPGQCGCGIPDTDSDGDRTADCNELCDNDPNKTEPGECGCGTPDTDVDNDGTLDCHDAFPYNPNEWLDTDLDGIGNNEDTDDDNDNMPDSWEEQYKLNPVFDDSLDDLDGDGYSNIYEYNIGSDPSNRAPDRPVLFLPANGQTGVSLSPTLQTQTFSDYENNPHIQTNWQISTDSYFVSLILDLTTNQHLISLSIPRLILNEDTLYYWRAKFQDSFNGESIWSEYYSFTCLKTSNDLNSNGIPDSQEVDNKVDLDGNGIADIEQINIKSLNTVTGNAQIGIKRSINVISIQSIMSVDSESILDIINKPDEIPLGLINFKLNVNKGTTAEVIVYFSENVPDKANWYKYDTINGWQNYSQHAAFSGDRNSMVLELKDGGFGDADCVENGIIVDPCGYGGPDIDSDQDGTPDYRDNCPEDPDKTEPGECGCGIPDTDSDNDGTADCNDNCPDDFDKTEPGECGCGIPDTDTDNDKTADCNDDCDNDPNKIKPGQCGCGNPDTDTDNDKTADCIDDCDNDPNKIKPGECGCGIPDTDSDNDGKLYCHDAFPDNPNEWQDTDLDGIGDNEDTDDDNDGMPDEWEKQYGLNPLVKDSGDDFDGDGHTNLYEYQAGTDPSNRPPDKPILFLPTNGATGVSLSPTLQTQAFSDYENNTHAQTKWQISTDTSFLSMALDLTSTQHLISLTLTTLILNENTQYYWRAEFQDNFNQKSSWSDPFSFTCLTTSNDLNSNGIPDSQEVDNTVDLDEDKIADNEQTDIKSLKTLVDDAQIGIKSSTNVISIEYIMSVHFDTILEPANRPDEMPLGLINFKLNVNKGSTAQAIVYLSENIPDLAKWYKYDTINGWQDYSQHTVFSADRESVTLELKDGGFGDADGVENGIIVDPCGYGMPGTDRDGDGTPDYRDGCPDDQNKTEPGVCGCGISDTDSDNDGTADCNDNCPDDSGKTEPGQCGCGISDTDSDNDGTADCNDGCPDDSDKTEPGECGCDIPDTDIDNDGTLDCHDAFPDNPNEWLDTDLDGIGNNEDMDDDDDGMPDKWEEQYGLNPIFDDSGDDFDEDGYSNLYEYQSGTDPSNRPPDKPILSLPENSDTGVSLTPTLLTQEFSDYENNTHVKTEWIVSYDSTFTEIAIVFEREYTSNNLESLKIPENILDDETTYYWKVRFYDNNSASAWSEFYSFTTLKSPEDNLSTNGPHCFVNTLFYNQLIIADEEFNLKDMIYFLKTR
ncbi:hypothetical protein GMMP15_260026 [Candidatus Magnetomoraceae bacterium gMMP-15]